MAGEDERDAVLVMLEAAGYDKGVVSFCDDSVCVVCHL